ncbi:class C sortase [Bifidobacterium choerinum]|nr:class C sortase [Bifidobacterium choerinum]
MTTGREQMMGRRERYCSARHGALFAPRIRRDLDRRDPVTAAFAIAGWACYIIAALLLAWVVGALVHNDMLAREAAANIASAPATWPDESRQGAYKRAQRYNAVLGTRFNGRIPADAENEEGVAVETLDMDYRHTLNVDGRGGMARLLIPKISVDIPVYHTTLDDVLDEGAGHIYGTAMPIGDDHTYSVLAAHSGGVQGMLFTRLGELCKGGVFYMDVLGGEQGYRVSDIRTIRPEQMESTLRELRSRYRDGPATITLVTCTPLGVNSHRLLVTGVREPIPAKIAPASTQKDGRLIAAAVAVVVFLVLLVAAIVFSRLRAKRRKVTAQKSATSST